MILQINPSTPHCLIDLYNRDLQTTVILFTTIIDFMQDWLNSSEFFPWPALCCLLNCRLNSVINALEGEYICLRDISINVNKLLAVQCCYCMFTCLSAFFILHFVVACLFLNPFLFIFIYTDVVAIFLFIHWSCK